MKFKIYVIPNMTIGATVVNYLADTYICDVDLVGGVPARNGWHVQPRVRRRWVRTGSTTIIPAEELTSWIDWWAERGDEVELIS